MKVKKAKHESKDNTEGGHMGTGSGTVMICL